MSIKSKMHKNKKSLSEQYTSPSIPILRVLLAFFINIAGAIVPIALVLNTPLILHYKNGIFSILILTYCDK